MNYRHAFHAGNFADLVKHAALLAVLRELTSGPPLTVIDTHAGAGLYDLSGPLAVKSGEGRAARALLADPAAPAAFAPLKSQIKGDLYPGSPLLVARALRPGDVLTACELRPEELAELTARLSPLGARVLGEDGYEALSRRIPARGALLVLIDPPFERPDDYERAAKAASGAVKRNPNAVVMVWLPLKDLETLDAFVRRLQDESEAPILLAQARLRDLSDPMKLNGCALAVLNPTPGLEGALEQICGWVVGTLGGPGAKSVVEVL
jgi:23S rRNA (adenine2030-N6)-methyltransferase